ncbi:hypothetical protein [Halobacillus sp. A5]|uniref:hypothetical protein n=1 Tax=Halobacillus sp. A5 TaxID=2880263 RepID=UPI0020A68AFF|nr:hypothetical protein [Halobacillus sp. A5]MCP3026636.1 hypothetical protein [Halobacillus sp. A5]
MKREVPIPYHYVWMVQDHQDPGKSFKRYVDAYVRHNFPGWGLVRINGMKAQINKK